MLKGAVLRFYADFMTPKAVQKLNKRMGDSLGRNPHGEPLYKWVHSESYFHWMRDIEGYKEVFHAFDAGRDKEIMAAHAAAMEQYESEHMAWLDLAEGDGGGDVPAEPVKPILQREGFITMEPVYRQRKMCPQYTDVWLVVHWHDAESEASWRVKYGSDALWSREGYYSPVNAWAERGQLPTPSLTDRIIEIVRKRRAMTAQEIYREGEREMEAIDRHVDGTRRDIIDDACTAFGAIPGSRSGGVSFPMPGVDYSAPAISAGEI